MDLIDICLGKDNIFPCILYIKDHFVKYSFLCGLTPKGATQVACKLENWIQLIGSSRV